jgi:hypothetical protein
MKHACASPLLLAAFAAGSFFLSAQAGDRSGFQHSFCIGKPTQRSAAR